MTDIDAVTGLPKLKDGQFWRVREQKATQWLTTRADEAPSDYTVVNLIENVTVEKRYPRYFFDIQFGYHPPVMVHEEHLLSTQMLWHPGLPVPDDYKGYAVSVDGKKYYTVHPSMVKPEMILAAAEKALEAYESTQTSRKLLGDYPPNKLSINE